MTDEELLEHYMKGFREELEGKPKPVKEYNFLYRAYMLGRWDALLGDDISSVDLQTDEQILDKIKQSDAR